MTIGQDFSSLWNGIYKQFKEDVTTLCAWYPAKPKVYGSAKTVEEKMEVGKYLLATQKVDFAATRLFTVIGMAYGTRSAIKSLLHGSFIFSVLKIVMVGFTYDIFRQFQNYSLKNEIPQDQDFLNLLQKSWTFVRMNVKNDQDALLEGTLFKPLWIKLYGH